MRTWKRVLVSAVAAVGLAGVAAPTAMANADTNSDVWNAVASASADSRDYWKAEDAYIPYTPVYPVWSLDGVPCTPKGGVRDIPAWACTKSQSIMVYLPNMREHVYFEGGVVSVYIVVGHEFAHYGIPQTRDSDLNEHRANCSAGAFVKVVAADRGWNSRDVARSAQDLFDYKSSYTAFNYGWQKGRAACVTYTP